MTTHDNQVITKRGQYTENGETRVVIAKIRYDDRCKNGRNTFSIVGEVYGPHGDRHPNPARTNGGKVVYMESCGCVHDDVEKAIPELAPLLKWHLTSSDGPMHYVANTMYHAESKEVCKGWIHSKERTIAGISLLGRCVKYTSTAEAEKVIAEAPEMFFFVPDEKSAKTADLDAARRSAIWMDATDADLTQPAADLKRALLARLPALMLEFRSAVESVGLEY